MNSVFVERDLYHEILHDFLSGKKSAGITGFLGMGGVGKTYTALKISWELIEKHDWNVVWVGLLQQGTDEALESLAKCFGLFFSNNIKREEKVSAIRSLFSKANRKFPKLLVVLDNAENFPRLDLLLEALVNVPVLITSRKRECSHVIPYHKLKPLEGDSAMQFCDSLLSYYNVVIDESKNDVKNLELLCKELGGHPLGIRLALSGFVRKPLLEQLKYNRFSLLLSEIKANSFIKLSSKTVLSGTIDERKLHKSIESTFLWTYEDLIRPNSSKPEKAAYTLLPILSALGTTNVTRKICVQGIQFLLTEKSDKTNEHPESFNVENEEITKTHKKKKLDKRVVPKWLDSLKWLSEESSAFDSAVSLLIDLALVEILDADTLTFALHPLIREFSFQQTDLDTIDSGNELDLVEMFSPPSENIFRMAIDVVSNEHGNEALLDLLPRLKQSRHLAEMAISKIEGQYNDIYYHPSNTTWPYLSILLNEALILAKDLELANQEIWIKLELGELTDRMGEPDGINLIDSGIKKYLENHDENKNGTKSFNNELIFDWIQNNYNKNVLWGSIYNCYFENNEKPKEDIVYHTLQTVRLLSCNKIDPTYVKRILKNIKNHIYINNIPMALASNLSCIGQNYNTNIILDLACWLKMGLSFGLGENAIKKANDILTISQNNHSDEVKKSKPISPEHLLNFKINRAIGSFEYDLINLDQFESDISIIRQETLNTGIRGYFLELSYCSALAKKFFEKADWDKVILFVNQALSSLEKLNESEEINIEKNELQLLDICAALLLKKQSKFDLQRCEKKLREVASFKSQPLIYLAKACLAAASDDIPDRDLNSSKSEAAFRQYFNYIPPYARSLLNQWRNWSNSCDEIALNNWAPWSIDYRNLPERVISKKDNRIMRLVRDGIQWTEEGKESWSWPFYIDEEPLDIKALELFCNELDYTLKFDDSKDKATPVHLTDKQISEYMKWAGKKIPTQGEVFSAWLQLEKKHFPVNFDNNKKALDFIISKIESVVVTGKSSTIELNKLGIIKKDQRSESDLFDVELLISNLESEKKTINYIDFIDSKKWLNTVPEINELFENIFVKSFKQTELSNDEQLHISFLLATSLSLSSSDKKRILDKARKLDVDGKSDLSIEKYNELVEVFEDERLKMLELEEIHPEDIQKLIIDTQADFIYMLNIFDIKTLNNWELWNVKTISIAHTNLWLEENDDALRYKTYNLEQKDDVMPVVRGVIPIFIKSDMDGLTPI